ncbi:MAG: FliM/FliN family flagellar motor switch protein [Hyphomonas sp.]
MAADGETTEGPKGRDRRDKSASGAHQRSIFGVPVIVTVSIGQQRMSVSSLLELAEGSVVALASRIEDPINLMVDDKLIARGELLETETGGLAVKITEIGERSSD